METYYNRIYPNGKHVNKFWKDLNFFYDCVPNSYLMPIYDSVKFNYRPPRFNVPWVPVGFHTNTFAINQFPSNEWWVYKYSEGFRDNSFVEMIHVKDDNPFYDVYGYWCYYAKGCGTFYNVGRSLRAYNKLDALVKLGFSSDKILSLVLNSRYMINVSFSDGNVPLDLARDIYPNSIMTDSDKMNNIIDLASRAPNRYDLEVYNTKALYAIDRINNTADWDKILCQGAKSQGYDSIQFLVQANGHGGWATEIVFVGMNKLLKDEENVWKGWNYINNRLYVMNPKSRQNKEKCSFNPEYDLNYSIVSCPQQNLVQCITEPSSNPPIYY